MRFLSAGLAILVLVFCSGSESLLFAQEDSLLPSKPLPVIALALPQAPQGITYLRKIRREKFLVTVDIPTLPSLYTADLGNTELKPFGEVVGPEKIKVRTPYFLWPAISFSSKNIHLSFRVSGMLSDQSEYVAKKNFQAGLLTEGSIWLVLVGAEGFKFREEVPSVVAGDGYEIDFNRQSYGGNAWAGVKLGNFHRSFIAVRAGRGLVESKGEEEYASRILYGPLKISLYSQQFITDKVSVEGRLLARYIAPSFKLESSRYELKNSKGRFGLNDKNFDNRELELKLELIPLSKTGPRVVIQRNYYYGSWNRLLFGDSQPEWQIYVRFAFAK